MMPERLVFEAFGPYVERQEIDFCPLERAGLFLIHGKTGSGKTTVLDAMAYALFGESSGGLRGDITAMRSDFAADEQDTKVDFIFRINGKKYRFLRTVRTRIKKNGEKELQVSQNAFFLNESGEYEPFFENPGIKNIRQKAEELLGLTYDQFRQVILLPQGRFEQLLVADSAEKEKILVTLFKAEKWQRVTDWLCGQALECRREKDTAEQGIESVLHQYDCETQEELESCAREKRELLAELKKRCEEAEKQAAAAEKAVTGAQTVESMFQEWKQAQEKAAVIRAQEKEIRRLEESCRLAEAAAQLLPLRKETVALQKRWQECDRKAQEAEKTIEDFNGKIEECIEALYGVLYELQEERKEENEKKIRSEVLLGQKERQYQELFSGYIENTAGMLAEALEEGKKCPVCGSIHHPHPAVRAGRIVGQEEVKAAEQDLRKIRKEIAEQEKRLFVLERQEESCKNGLRKLGAESQKGEKSKKGGGDPKKWLERAEEFKTGRNTAVNSRKIFREEAEQAHAAFESAMENFRTACRTQGFETDEEFRAACLPDERLKEQKERIQSYAIDRKITEENERTLAERLHGVERLDIEQMQKEWEQKAREKQKADAEFAKIKAEEDLLLKAEGIIKKKAGELKKITEKYVELDQFSRILRGSNGVGLQRYVLGVMLSAITQEANRLLQKVHDGRYQLCRSIESSGRTRKAGLDLEVFDAYSGEKRNVKSLSGGEKFLVALALSLGLSAVVQAQSGGIHIDALFIDEGFGSLDPASIENALDVLASVRGGSKLIGIISHVQMLQENIETTIEVCKNRTGSTLAVTC